MSHTIHDIAVAKQIGSYSDAIEVAPNLRWLMTSGTPGFTEADQVSADITGQSELAWENVLRVLAKAGMAVHDIVKVTQYLTRAEDIKAYSLVRKPLSRHGEAGLHATRHSSACLAEPARRSGDHCRQGRVAAPECGHRTGRLVLSAARTSDAQRPASAARELFARNTA